MERFEEQYPVNARKKEIKQILQFVTRGQSCQLISVPGAGRSTVLRLLAYHEKLRNKHLASQGWTLRSNFLFVYVNFAEIPSFGTLELNKFLFLSIPTAIRVYDDPKLIELGKEVYSLFKEALSLNDALIMLQRLKRAIEKLNNQTIVPVFLFDRFSEFADKIPREFFANLYALRISGGRIPIVFSTHRPLEELLPADLVQSFYEFFSGNHIFLSLYDEPATSFRISVLEKEYGKKLNLSIKKELVRLTGGHGKLTKLAAQIILTKDKADKASLARSNLARLLAAHNLIKNSLLEIWQSLPLKERGKSLFPLYDEFVKRGIPQTLVPKIIRLDQVTNEIYFGDQPLSGLTAYEFRLLSYLIKNPNRVCEREEIINAVWTESKTQAGVTDEALDQMIFRLRRKIEDEADNPKHLLTVKGRGFRFIP